MKRKEPIKGGDGMTPDEPTLIKWLKQEIDSLREAMDETRAEVARLSSAFSRYVQPCNEFRQHLDEHARRETRWWGFWLRVLTQLVTAAIGAGVAMAASGRWPGK